MKINKLLYLVFIFILLCGCHLKNVEKNSGSKEKNNESETACEQFINQFPKEYPDYKLVDLKEGSAKNYPILLVAVGESIDNGTSTLFIVDDSGIGEVTLASNKRGIYRKEDGLVLDKNVILVSLNLIGSHQNEEIHDFKITVTKHNKQGVSNTLYSSEEDIRKEQK